MTRATEPVDTAAAFAVRLAAKLPDGEANGLKPWAQQLVEKPRARHYAVVELDTARVIDDVDDDTDTAVVRILRVEIVDSDAAAGLMLAAASQRGADPSLFDADSDE